MQFEWDRPKAAANRRKHGVTFEPAASVFADLHAAIFNDPDHPLMERRELIVGMSERHLFDRQLHGTSWIYPYHQCTPCHAKRATAR